MMITPSNMVLVLTGITTGLMAGLFYSWSISVTAGLTRLPDAEYITAMQAMNRAILNPAFFVCFFGTAILLPVSSFMHYTPHPSAQFWFLLAATLMYLIGVMAVTIFGNIPLNEALDAFSQQSAQEITAQREKFEGPWNRLNNIRTVTSIFALAFVLIACIRIF